MLRRECVRKIIDIEINSCWISSRIYSLTDTVNSIYIRPEKSTELRHRILCRRHGNKNKLWQNAGNLIQIQSSAPKKPNDSAGIQWNSDQPSQSGQISRCDDRWQFKFQSASRIVGQKPWRTSMHCTRYSAESRLSTKLKLTLHKTIIRPKITYASPSWDNISSTAMNKLQLMQNKILKSILGLPRTFSTHPITQYCQHRLGPGHNS